MVVLVNILFFSLFLYKKNKSSRSLILSIGQIYLLILSYTNFIFFGRKKTSHRPYLLKLPFYNYFSIKKDKYCKEKIIDRVRTDQIKHVVEENHIILFETLPIETIETILMFLDKQSLVRFAFAYQVYSKIVLRKIFWRSIEIDFGDFDFDNYFISVAIDFIELMLGSLINLKLNLKDLSLLSLQRFFRVMGK